MSEVSRDNFYKNKYLETAKAAKERGIDLNPSGGAVFTLEMLAALKDMARNNVFPDARFGDAECNAWSLFR